MRTEKIDNCYLPHFFGFRFGIFLYKRRIVKITAYSMPWKIPYKVLFESRFGLEGEHDGGEQTIEL